MSIRPNPEADVMDAILATFRTSGIGVQAATNDPIKFDEMLWDGDPEDYLRENSDKDGVFFRCIRSVPGPSNTVNVGEYEIQIQAHVFKRGGNRSKVWRGVAAILWRIAQVVGEEEAKVDGADGGGGLFGYGASTAMSRVIGLAFRGPMTKRVLDQEHEFWVHGQFEFGLIYRLDIAGGTTNG